MAPTHRRLVPPTILVISFDSFRSHQTASAQELDSVRRFLEHPDHLIFVCPHHDIGEEDAFAGEDYVQRQLAEHLHHGDRGIPPRQGFGGFARSVLAGLGVPIENRFGLRPAVEPNGDPSPVEVEASCDVLHLMDGVEALNLHAHLPQLERIDEAVSRMDVLVRQSIDLKTPPHPFTANGRTSFDALLQSRPEVFSGKLLVCDTTLFSSTAGGAGNLRRFWSNLIKRPQRSVVAK